MMDMMRLGFANAQAHVACPESMQVDNDWLVDPVRIGERAERRFDKNHTGIHGMSQYPEGDQPKTSPCRHVWHRFS
jgi:hypothetical protein